MLIRRKILYFICFFALGYIVCLLFFSNDFEKNNRGEAVYQLSYIDLIDNNEADKILKNILKISESQVFIVESDEKISGDFLSGFYIYQKKIARNLLILSKFKLGKNRTDFFEHFLTPAYTGIVNFPTRKILFSFFSLDSLPLAKESSFFRNSIIKKRIATYFWHRKKSSLVIAKSKGKIFNIKNLNRVNYLYKFFSLSNTPHLYKSEDLKIFNVKKNSFETKIFLGER